MQLDREDRIVPATTRPKSHILLIVAIIALFAAAIAALAIPELNDAARRSASSAASLVGATPPESEFADAYRRLGIAPLRKGLLASHKISSGLAKLSRESCDKTAVHALGAALVADGEERIAAEALHGFAAACPNSEAEDNRAAQIFFHLADNEKVIAIADALIAKNPGIADYRYLRGKALAGVKRYREALPDYTSAIELQHDRRAVNERVFMELANIYAATGSPCDAALTIIAWVMLDPAKRNTPKARKMVQEYLAQGCRNRSAEDQLNKL